MTSLDSPHHPLPPPMVDQAFRDVRFRPVKAVEWSTRYIEVELRAVRGERGTVSVEYFDWRAARVRLFLDHDGRHRVNEHCFRHPARPRAGDIARDFAAAGGMADMDHAPKVESLHQRSEEPTSELQSLMRTPYAV